MKEFFWKHDHLVKFFLIVIVLALGIDLALLNKALLRAYPSEKKTSELINFPQISVVDNCGEECQKAISQKVAEAVATLSGKPAPASVSPTKTGKNTTFIPIGGSFSATKTDWTDVKQGELYLDSADYGASPQISWEASLKVAHGNGKAFARLFDVTHGIAVANSEVSVENQADYKQVSSGNLNLWSGRNLYRVQVKSLNSFEVFFDSGRIKIVSQQVQ